MASKAKSFNVLAKTWFIKTNLQYSILVYTFPLYNYFSKHNAQFNLFYQQGGSQDLNQPLQDIAQNFDDDVIVMTLTSLS